jgi:hypothetical protein
MKTFVLGILVGALVCFGVIRFIDHEVAPDAAPERPIAAALAPARSVNSDPAKSADVERPAVEPPPALAKAPSDWVEELTEEEAQELCSYASRLQQAREQAVKDAEPKDAGWAYSMEQLMKQHIEMHLPADQYTKLQIECRTTFCELRMEGKSTDGRELAEKIVQQIQFQDWSDIAQKGNGGGSEGESWYIHYDWFRPRTERDRRAWFWHRDVVRQRQREQQQPQQ